MDVQFVDAPVACRSNCWATCLHCRRLVPMGGLHLCTGPLGRDLGWYRLTWLRGIVREGDWAAC